MSWLERIEDKLEAWGDASDALVDAVMVIVLVLLAAALVILPIAGVVGLTIELCKWLF